MKESLYDILKGKFLVSNDAFNNWRFILFCTVLAIIMIGSSHSAERKVHEIAKMNDQVRELRSEFVDRRSNLMRLKMESTISRKMAGRGIKPSEVPPTKIIIKEKE
ncbi:FtsL-like putative cell division protein [Salinimicrobium gaetbulicola]|uniref:FtsL-like putative cell division protein n=1 Tax=Salinimicrobium gaetbulicola TaxID=999702 RepID=A0ABW3IF99_9FLAO